MRSAVPPPNDERSATPSLVRLPRATSGIVSANASSARRSASVDDANLLKL